MTQKEIAKKLNVSVMTVSKALRNHPDISDEMKERIRSEAEKNYYVPNLFARELLKKKSNVIGFIFPDITFDYAQKIMDGAKKPLMRNNYRGLIGLTSWSAEEEENEVDLMLQRMIDGIICQPISDNSNHFHKVIAHNRPLVFIGNSLNNCPDASWVGLDGHDATNKIMEHLFDLGHRRIAFVAPDNIENSRALQPRFDAYKSFHETHAMKLDNSLICLSRLGKSHEVYSLIDHIMQLTHSPTAILCVSDVIAYEVMNRLLQTGKRIPEDVSVAGIGGLAVSGYEMISLTTVSLNSEIIGEMAVDIIIEQLMEESLTPITTLLKGELVTRRSTGKLK